MIAIPTSDQGAVLLPREPSEDAIETIARKLYEQSYADMRADDAGLKEPEPWPDLNDAQRGFGLNMARAAYVALVEHLEGKHMTDQGALERASRDRTIGGEVMADRSTPEYAAGYTDGFSGHFNPVERDCPDYVAGFVAADEFVAALKKAGGKPSDDGYEFNFELRAPSPQTKEPE